MKALSHQTIRRRARLEQLDAVQRRAWEQRVCSWIDARPGYLDKKNKSSVELRWQRIYDAAGAAAQWHVPTYMDVPVWPKPVARVVQETLWSFG